MTIPEKLRRLADWAEAKGLADEEVVMFSASNYDLGAHLKFPALLRLYPGRTFKHDDDLHICFLDGDVRVIARLDYREWSAYQAHLKRIERSVYATFMEPVEAGK